MKCFIVIACVFVGVAICAPRAKRQAYELPDGSEFIVGPIRTSFSCQSDGYFADVDNDCKIFHICNSVPRDDGTVDIQQYSFLCGNQTVFNQLSFTCAFADEAVPCQNAPDFFYLNQNIGVTNVPFLTDQDVQRAQPLIAQSRDRFAASAPVVQQDLRPSGFRGRGFKK